MVIFWYGGYLVLEGKLSAGNLVSFLLYSNNFGNYASIISGLFSNIFDSAAISQRIYNLIDYNPTVIESKEKLKLEENDSVVINFKNVGFSYASKKEIKILDNFNLKIEKNEMIAFVGSSGGGKSTIANLLQRFYDPDSGVITLSDVDISKLEINNLRKNIGYVSQEPPLLSGTIEENVTYGVDSYNHKLLQDSIKISCCEEFIYNKV